MKLHSVVEENYLKAIFHLTQNGSPVNTNPLAKFLQTTPASVTDMAKKLSDKSLIQYEPYKGVCLTEQGKEVAITIIRKHRLWEVFLAKTLHFPWDRIHETAEQLEHIESPDLIDKLDAFLGFPKFDPHGDPIPNARGEFTERHTLQLSQCEIGKPLIMAGVMLHSPEFLQYLERVGLILGANIIILEKLAFGESMGIKIGEKEIVLTGDITRNILVMESAS